MKRIVTLVALAVGGALCASAFSLDSIERWTGSGTNRAALVVDWHDGTRPHALAWGFRFNQGEGTTGLDMLNAVAAADTGLAVTFDDGVPVCIAYDRPTREGDILPETGSNPALRWTAYTFDHDDDGEGTWGYWTCDGELTYAASNMTHSAASPASRLLVDASWDAWTLGTDGIPLAPSYPAAALYYPFATEVVSYTQGIIGPPDMTDFPHFWAFYNDPTTALGRPTVDTTGDDTVPLGVIVPVVPVYPAFRAFEVVTVGLSGGELVLAFDHPVYDNPDNPYGAAFIVFGNAVQATGAGQYWRYGDPELTAVGDNAFTEGGEVYVSQDAMAWHRVSGGVANAAFHGTADDFAPTLGRLHDPDRPAPGLYGQPHGTNEWWGGATDPTIPVTPAILPADLDGMSLAAIARHYRGSAGGTAFSIHDLDLAADPDNAMKWIRYVKITSENTAETPEVDAIADVSPALPVNLWRDAHFHWLEDPALEGDRIDASGDGIPNLMKYALGRDPRIADDSPLYTLEDGAPGAFTFAFAVNPDADDVTLDIVRADDLAAPAADWNTNGTFRLRPGLVEAPFSGSQGFMRLRARHQ